MPLALRADQSPPPRGLIVWRVLAWLLLLLAAMGCLQYVHHAQQVWDQLQAISPGDAGSSAALRGMLGWDVAYLLAAFALIVICAGCILRQAWARPCMRVAALLLAAWLVARGVSLLTQWNILERANAIAMTPSQGGAAMQKMLTQLHQGYPLARRRYELALLFEAAGIPLLLWLAWRLGRPSVRAQFHTRRR